MPFDAESFDLVICQAAFKNFLHPDSGIDEMYRVLRTGGTAVIQDMAMESTHADIEHEVNGMELGRLTAFMTKAILEGLQRRAYSRDRFERLAAASRFEAREIRTEGMTLEVRLTKSAAS